MNMSEKWYPIFLNLTGRLCLVVGGGEVAERKARTLLEAGARVRVVAPLATGEILRLKGVEVRLENYTAEALDGVTLAIAATDVREVNARVAADCRQKNILCNVVDDPQFCDFILPSIMRQGPLVVAVSTGGASPSAAAKIRREIEETFGPAYGRWIETLAAAREEIRSRLADEASRRQVLLRLSEDDVLEAARKGAEVLKSKISDILAAAGVRKKQKP
jgi:precorrin-2 dehydrogenase/sirohydrochlorin ferrochelatase